MSENTSKKISIKPLNNNKFKTLSLIFLISSLALGGTTSVFMFQSFLLRRSNNSWMELSYFTLLLLFEDSTEDNTLNDNLDIILESETYFYQTIEYNKSFDTLTYTLRMMIPQVCYFWYKLFQPHDPPTLLHLDDWLNFTTPDDYIINYTAHYITQGLSDQEDIADTVLNFVQDKGNFTACIHYISEKTELPKYPLETITEGGGDCEDHAILYASMMKALGFQVALILSLEAGHMWCAVHLDSAPTQNSQSPSYWYVDYKGVRYYTAETTSWGWRVGDLPSALQSVSFFIFPL